MKSAEMPDTPLAVVSRAFQRVEILRAQETTASGVYQMPCRIWKFKYLECLLCVDIGKTHTLSPSSKISLVRS
jgi:hypothetical protein